MPAYYIKSSIVLVIAFVPTKVIRREHHTQVALGVVSCIVLKKAVNTFEAYHHPRMIRIHPRKSYSFIQQRMTCMSSKERRCAVTYLEHRPREYLVCGSVAVAVRYGMNADSTDRTQEGKTGYTVSHRVLDVTIWSNRQICSPVMTTLMSIDSTGIDSIHLLFHLLTRSTPWLTVLYPVLTY